MKLYIHAIGHLKSKTPESLMIENYQKRICAIAPSLGFSEFKILSYDTKKELSGQALRAFEGDMLMKNITNPQDKIIILDERGMSCTSTEFSQIISGFRDNHAQKCHFLIGGADGLSDNIRKESDKMISFGKLTWPHMMVRVMICEQIYRTMTILSNHPYHRE